ncbi:universal stress protein [Aquisalimonas sp.]|uniref:universal stress protein n=1 Tax=Aquisalimonas sp. TaxID=1872621 RepID=UPI0025C231BA|nr:universal stress protein [Aquisalimonas sp.]
MFTHVVVAAHFASASSGLFEDLEELRRLGTQEITVVDVLLSHLSDTQNEANRREARRHLEEEKSTLARAGFRVNVELRTGQPAHELSTIARARGASLILVGTRGEGHFREFFRGSTVLQLIRKTQTPTLVEPVLEPTHGLTVRGFRSVLLGTDFSSSCFEAERHAAELVAYCEKLVLCHVLEDDAVEALGEEAARSDAEQRLGALAEQFVNERDRVVTRIERGNPSRRLNEVAEEEGSTMLIVGKRGRSPIRELMLGSTAEKVVRRANRSVLLVPRMGLI